MKELLPQEMCTMEKIWISSTKFNWCLFFLCPFPFQSVQNCGNYYNRQLGFTPAALGADKRTTYLFFFWCSLFVGFYFVFSLFPQIFINIGPDP